MSSINLSDCQKKKLISSLKNNKSIFLRLTKNQVDAKKYKPIPYISLSKTKKGYSLKIDANEEIKKGGFLPLILAAMGTVAGITGAAYGIIKGASDSNEQKRHNAKMEELEERKVGKMGSGVSYKVQYKCCDKCYGKGMISKA